MKKTALTFLYLLCAFQLCAEPISQATARATAHKFFLSKGLSMKSSGAAYRASRKASPTAVNSAYYYVFDADEGRGYVIVSGDDRTAPILGYVDRGTFCADSLPDNMRSWLQLYADQIMSLDSPDATTPAKSPVRKAAQSVRHAIKPLLASLWNQGDPYNDQTPLYTGSDGKQYHCATGCVATAIAQVLYYYRYPSETKGYIAALKCDGSGGDYKVDTTLAGVSAGERIDWDSMHDTYDGYNGLSTTQRQAIGRFNLLVGQAFRMGYGPSSGATFCGAQPLKSVFGYDKSTCVVSRGSYTLDDWTQLIYSELATGHPVAMSGFSSGGGHAFVLDGFDGTGMFHINWGWGGYQNGYFMLTIMNPDDNTGIGASSSSDGYSMGQDIMLVRKPGETATPGSDLPASLTMNDTRIEQDSIVFCNYINWTGTAGTFNTAVGLVQDDGSYLPVGQYYENGQAQDQQQYRTTLGVNYYMSLRFVVTRTGLAPGTYKVVPISQPSGGKTWVSTFNPAMRFIKLDIDKRNTVKLTLVDGGTLAVDTIKCTSDRVTKREQTIDVTFSNRGENEYYGEVRLFASKTSDKGSETSRAPVSLKPGQSVTLSFYFTPGTSGTYNLWLATGSDGSGVIGQGTVQISSTAVKPKVEKGDMTFDNLNADGQLVGNVAYGHMRVVNKGAAPYEGNIVVNIWQADHGVNVFYMQTSTKTPVTIAAGATADVSFRFTGLTVGKDYGFNVCYTLGGSEQEIMGLGNVHQTVGGLLVYAADGSVTAPAVASDGSYLVPTSAAAVEASTLSSLPAFKLWHQNLNTVFVLPASVATPSTLTGRNVVKNGTADTINITDDHPFYTPVDFTARHVKYTRKLDTTKEWETLALPFTPTSIKANGWPVNWQHKNTILVMKEFSRVDGDGTVNFDYPTRLYDNTPYIIAAPRHTPTTAVFSATDAAIPRTGSVNIIANTDLYSYMGTVNGDSLSAVYVMNDKGTAFEPVDDTAAVSPFRAWFTTTLPKGQRAERLPLGLAGDNTTDMANTPADSRERRVVAVYNLAGQPVKPSDARGIVIVRYDDGTTAKLKY